MIFSTVLLSLTGYCWYLIFTSTLGPENLPVTGSGTVGLIITAALPAILGVTAGKKMLDKSPTVLKILLLTIRNWLIYSLLAALAGYTYTQYRTATAPASLIVYLPAAIWQLLGWAGGTYSGICRRGNGSVHSADIQTRSDRPEAIKAVELSAVAFFPAVLMLIYMGYTGSLTAALIIGWFITLTFTLSLEGSEAKGAVVRYEILIAHTVIPLLAAGFFFALAFSGEFLLLLVAVQKGLRFLVGYLVYFLDLLFGEAPEAENITPEGPNFHFEPEPEGPLTALSPWFMLPFIILSLFLLLPAMYGLLKFLRGRISAPPATAAKSHFSALELLAQIARCLTALARNLLAGILLAITRLQACAQKSVHALVKYIRAQMSAGNTYEQVIRSYKIFLLWGRRRGCVRKPGETPLEYADRLLKTASKQPLACNEILQLTELFMETRYGKKPVRPQKAAFSKTLLKSITGRKIF